MCFGMLFGFGTPTVCHSRSPLIIFRGAFMSYAYDYYMVGEN